MLLVNQEVIIALLRIEVINVNITIAFLIGSLATTSNLTRKTTVMTNRPKIQCIYTISYKYAILSNISLMPVQGCNPKKWAGCAE